LSLMVNDYATWAPKITQEILTLSACSDNASSDGACIVDCLTYCNCKGASTGAPCKIAPALPSAPAPTAEKQEATCASEANTEFCSELMPTVPPGNFFFCYNFCNGTYLSTCDENGQCGATDCPGSIPGITGYVGGCKDSHRLENKKKSSAYSLKTKNSRQPLAVAATLFLGTSLVLTFSL